MSSVSSVSEHEVAMLVAASRWIVIVQNRLLWGVGESDQVAEATVQLSLFHLTHVVIFQDIYFRRRVYDVVSGKDKLHKQTSVFWGDRHTSNKTL